jgi:type IV secretion system protein VirD4
MILISLALLALGVIGVVHSRRSGVLLANVVYATIIALGVAFLIRDLTRAAGETPVKDYLVGIVILIVLAIWFQKAGVLAALRRRAASTVLAGGALVGAWYALAAAPFYAQLLVGAVGVGAGWVWWQRRGRSLSLSRRWRERTLRTGGVATTLDILRVASGIAMHLKAAAVRPHLREVGWRERWATPTQELAVRLVRAAGMWVWVSVEDVIVLFGGPRTGKTAWLCGAILDAVGAVVTTSTRTDVLEATRAGRAELGPVWTYNPGGLGGIPSTVNFDPVHGCDDPTVAVERAADMIPEREGAKGDAAAWDAQSRRVYAAFLHAAGLAAGDCDSHDILRWVANPEATADEVQTLLLRSPVESFGPDVAQFVTTNPTTRSSITSGIMPALQWLNSPAAVASTRGGEPLDVADLLRLRGTVYMLGRHASHTHPLLAGLTGYIARESRRLAALQRGGRLDPPLTLALDEAARVVPVPLPDWTGDFGGSGIQLILAFQSRADLLDRWGDTGAAKILNNAGGVMLFGGTKDSADLNVWTTLAGMRDERVEVQNGEGKVTSKSVRETPVFTPSRLANLPKWRVVAFVRGMPPVIGRVVPVWKRRPSHASRLLGVFRVFSRPAPALPVTHLTPLPTPVPAPAPTPAGGAPDRELTNASR